MIRKIYSDLINWKQSPDRKPLILQGARQTGKTYIVNIFGTNEYDNVLYCNFEKESALQSLFTNLDPHVLLPKLSNYKRKEILPGKTLIIFDEAQACPEALTSLKYFNEEANEYHVIALGSLLGVSVHRSQFSFPVGKVKFMNMYPMDFEEYLLACGEEFLIRQIREHYLSDLPIEQAFHEKALSLYKEFLFVGGMPEVVEDYIKTKNPDITRNKQYDVLTAYQNDMGKYNKESEIPKTKAVYKNISTQLSKENKKFQYRMIKSGGRAAEFQDAIEWLCLAGIANQQYKLEQIKLPLNAYKSLSDFKMYMNDVGLCCASQDILFNDIVFDNMLMYDFKGGLVENYINNQLIINGFEPFYWTNANSAEVDFIIRVGEDIVPVEVKSSDNTRAKSLSVFVKQFNSAYSIRISTKNFGFENKIKSVPLYAAFCIKSNSKDVDITL